MILLGAVYDIDGSAQRVYFFLNFDSRFHILLRDPPTASDEKLQSCKACGCYNKVAVHMPLDAMDITGVEFPEWCWKKSST